MQFGGTPRCERCGGAVYHAEQVMGPARKIYHKLCLKCEQCDKRLDPGSLVQHDNLPYCSRCHTQLFGTRDLRNANHLPATPRSPRLPPSPEPVLPPRTPRAVAPPQDYYVAPDLEPEPAPTTPTKPLGGRTTISMPLTGYRTAPTTTTNPDTTTTAPSLPPRAAPTLPPRAAPALPPRAPPSPSPATPTRDTTAPAPDSPITRPDMRAPRPIPQGTPASAVLTDRGVLRRTDSPRSKVGVTPDYEDRCECGKRVYAAEQVFAIGRKWHRGCLRCVACNSTLQPARVSDRDGQPWCKNCYAREHGPEGIAGKR